MLQLDIFSTEEMSLLNSNFEKCKGSTDKVRKAVFARLDEVEKKMGNQQAQIEELRQLINEIHEFYSLFVNSNEKIA